MYGGYSSKYEKGGLAIRVSVRRTVESAVLRVHKEQEGPPRNATTIAKELAKLVRELSYNEGA